MMFYEGQRVRCVDASRPRNRMPMRGITWLTRGAVYTIRAYVCGGKWPAVVVNEIRNPDVVYMDGGIAEAGFWERRFVPITDISDLEALADDVGRFMSKELETTPQREEEDA